MKFFYLCLSILFLTSVFAETKIEELEQFEIRSYSPQSLGVKDLVFEARIEGLKNIIEKNLVVGKLEDLYFKIYWINAGDFRVEVMGLPKGFTEVKDDLKQLIKGKLDFVIPEKFSTKLKPYTLKVEPILDGKLVKAIDETYTLAIPEIDITFDKSNKLKFIETKLSQSPVRTEFFHSPKSWSNNKLVLDKVVSISGVKGASLTIDNDVEYVNVGGVGFPSKLVVKNTSEYMTAPTEKEKSKIEKKDVITKVFFTKYEVNTGKAQRFITEGSLGP